MAFAPTFTIVEQGDNKLLTITDSTGTGSDGWDGTPDVTHINDSTNNLTLDITITLSDGTETTYDTIDLYTLNGGGFTTTEDLVFELDCTDFTVSGVALGTSSDEFPDGVYDVTYAYQKATNNYHTDYSILIDGQVKTDLYELLRTIPTEYECDYNHEREILDVIFMKGYYDAMLATAAIGRDEQVIEQLGVLEALVEDGSNNTW